MKLKSVSKTEVAKRYGTGTKTSSMRDAVKPFADFLNEALGDESEAVLIDCDVSEKCPDGTRGVIWMDFSDDDVQPWGTNLQDECKREKGGGMAAIVSQLNRNFRESHMIRATLRNTGKTAESGEIVVYRVTADELAKSKASKSTEK